MKNVICYMFSLCFLFVYCHSGADKDNVTQVKTEPGELVGQTLEYRYGEDVYLVHFDSDTSMHWQAIAGSEKAETIHHERYVIDSLADEIFFITWGEENGIGVSQILDFKNGIVFNHLLKGRDVSQGTGKIAFVSN